MGICRDSQHKRRATGGRRIALHKKRKFEMGRQPAMTKIGTKKLQEVRGRGGNTKFRAQRLETGNFSWGSEGSTRKVRILDVVYNASNNELVRTKTLVKGAIVLIDAHPFKEWYENHFGRAIGVKKNAPKTEAKEEVAKSDHVKRTLARRQKEDKIDAAIDDQMASGRLLARISSRPGQSGRCDGVILESNELAFYKKMIAKK
jgi:small subunit ribosomal protein S8e